MSPPNSQDKPVVVFMGQPTNSGDSGNPNLAVLQAILPNRGDDSGESWRQLHREFSNLNISTLGEMFSEHRDRERQEELSREAERAFDRDPANRVPQVQHPDSAPCIPCGLPPQQPQPQPQPRPCTSCGTLTSRRVPRRRPQRRLRTPPQALPNAGVLSPPRAPRRPRYRLVPARAKEHEVRSIRRRQRRGFKNGQPVPDSEIFRLARLEGASINLPSRPRPFAEGLTVRLMKKGGAYWFLSGDGRFYRSRSRYGTSADLSYVDDKWVPIQVRMMADPYRQLCEQVDQRPGRVDEGDVMEP